MLVLALLAQAAEVAKQPSWMDQWIGPIITSTMGVVATFFAYLSSRDKNKNETEQKRIERDERITKLEESVKSCHEDREELRKDRQELRAEIAALRKRADAAERRHHREHPDPEKLPESDS